MKNALYLQLVTNVLFLQYQRVNALFLQYQRAYALGPDPTKDMQTPVSFDPVFMKDAECAETNKKSIFRFMFFELSWKFSENGADFLVQKLP